ncbi:MAG: CPBP family glutamic-type intramembrane protease [Candidatus Hodarchaeales archaeon]
MRKITIVEIENSYLNLFTPAVIVVIGYFLFNLIAWPILFLELLIEETILQINMQILDSVIVSIVLVLVSSIVYFIFIPKLKVKSVEYRRPNTNGFFVIFILFSVAIFSLFSLEFLFVLFDINMIWEPMGGTEFDDLFVQLLSIVLTSLSSVAYHELIYRRTVIPLLEDRGVSSFHAVILSSLGYSLTFMPTFIMYPNISGFVYNFSLLTILGLCAGFTYIITRNILFPFILGIFLAFYTELANIGQSLHHGNLFTIITDSIELFSILVTISALVYLLWKNKAKESSIEMLNRIKIGSVPNIKRGIIGFFLISIGLLALQAFVVKIGREVTHNIFPEYFIFITPFYLVVFTIPFFLTTSTEYAQD